MVNNNEFGQIIKRVSTFGQNVIAELTPGVSLVKHFGHTFVRSFYNLDLFITQRQYIQYY
jgi:hypothetical protein